MDPATLMAWVTVGKAALDAGVEVYGLFRKLARTVPGLDAGHIERSIQPIDTTAADAAVEGEIR